MFHPKDHGPQNIWEEAATMHFKLASAYSIIAQYDEQDRERERQRREEIFKPRPYVPDEDDIAFLRSAAAQLVEGAEFAARSDSGEVLRDIADRMEKARK